MIITRYNESAADARSCYLTTLVDEKEVYNGIAFSYPSGTIRLNDDITFTHFTAMIAGIERVFMITGITAVNNHVVDYDYMLDGLKDYFMHDGSLKGAQITRSTNVSDKSAFVLNGDRVPSGKIIEEITDGYDLPVSRFFPCIVVNGYSDNITYKTGTHKRVIALPDGGEDLYIEALGAHSNIVNGAVDRVMLLPFNTQTYEPLFDGCTTSSTTGFTVNNQFISVGEASLDLHQVSSEVTWVVNTNISVSIDDYYDVNYSSYQLYVPMYGFYTLEAHKLINYGSTIKIRYHFNLLDATVAVSLEGFPETLSNYVSLPMLTVPSSEHATASMALNYNSLGTFMSAARQLDPIATFKASADYSYNKAMVDLLPVKYSGGGGYSGIIRDSFLLVVLRVELVNTEIEQATISGYATGSVPAEGFTMVDSNKYWLLVNNLTVNGPAWYKQIVMSAIGSDYILYNEGE